MNPIIFNQPMGKEQDSLGYLPYLWKTAKKKENSEFKAAKHR